MLSWLQPDIAAHVSGGPIPMSDDDIDAMVDNTSFALEVCSSGNYRSTARLVRAADAKDQLARLTLGTDTPGGTGVIPRGMLRNVLYFALDVQSHAGPGDRGRDRQHRGGARARCRLLDAGSPADIVVCGPITGSAGTTFGRHRAWRSARHHAMSSIDGEIVVDGRSRQTPPPNRRTFFSCCEAHSGFGCD